MRQDLRKFTIISPQRARRTRSFLKGIILLPAYAVIAHH